VGKYKELYMYLQEPGPHQLTKEEAEWYMKSLFAKQKDAIATELRERICSTKSGEPSKQLEFELDDNKATKLNAWKRVNLKTRSKLEND